MFITHNCGVSLCHIDHVSDLDHPYHGHNLEPILYFLGELLGSIDQQNTSKYRVFKNEVRGNLLKSPNYLTPQKYFTLFGVL